MTRALIAVGGLLFVLGCVASVQDAEDSSLRLIPALILRLERPFVESPDFLPYLTQAGIALVYIIPGALLIALGGMLRYRRHAAQGRAAPGT